MIITLCTNFEARYAALNDNQVLFTSSIAHLIHSPKICLQPMRKSTAHHLQISSRRLHIYRKLQAEVHLHLQNNIMHDGFLTQIAHIILYVICILDLNLFEI